MKISISCFTPHVKQPNNFWILATLVYFSINDVQARTCMFDVRHRLSVYSVLFAFSFSCLYWLVVSKKSLKLLFLIFSVRFCLYNSVSKMTSEISLSWAHTLKKHQPSIVFVPTFAKFATFLLGVVFYSAKTQQSNQFDYRVQIYLLCRAFTFGYSFKALGVCKLPIWRLSGIIYARCEDVAYDAKSLKLFMRW